mmetsp:Transcript_7624/g.17258  ORF Transcript_7624/g.17258 Transcript_7624/m.17258 type:complete len:95 (-) Transcript_7624:6-290(-)
MSSSNPNICSTRFSIQCVRTARWTLAMLHFWEKLDGKVVERSCFWRADVEVMEAVPFMLGMVTSFVQIVVVVVGVVVSYDKLLQYSYNTYSYYF